ncbi:MAG TPA: hypothetical protein VG826_04065 [Pirellulales bacterium]|nr:hypothetical protein [Pirellulales bacterium]
MRRSLSCLVFSAVLAIVAARATAGESLHLAPTKGVVLLRNGQVLEGTIARAGDYYYISKPGSEIRVKTSEVEKVADRLEELYEEKRGRVDPTRLQDRLDLAEWCVDQKLVDQAAKELAEAALLEPQHPRIVLLQRRLELARRAETETTPPHHAVENGPSAEDLDRFVRGLPGHAVETFTSTIQPLLVNNCTNSGCHGSQSAGKLRLLRLPLSGTVNRRRTQRNLYAVWQVIDVDRPAASPILTQPVRPHGNAKGAIFSGRETAQYRQLVSWVYEITRQRRPKESPADDAAEPLPHRMANKERKKKLAAIPSPPGDTNGEKPREGDPEDLEEVETETLADDKAVANSQHGQADQDENYVPVDPFDPEIFNRRYSPEK